MCKIGAGAKKVTLEIAYPAKLISNSSCWALCQKISTLCTVYTVVVDATFFAQFLQFTSWTLKQNTCLK